MKEQVWINSDVRLILPCFPHSNSQVVNSFKTRALIASMWPCAVSKSALAFCQTVRSSVVEAPERDFTTRPSEEHIWAEA